MQDQKRPRSRPARRNYRRWTPEDDARAVRDFEDGLSCDESARNLGVTSRAMTRKRKALGLKHAGGAWRRRPERLRTHKVIGVDLTPRQAKFVREYLVDLRPAAAMVRAGYSGRNAKCAGSRLVRTPHVAEAIRRSTAQLAEQMEISTARVLLELARIAFSDVRDVATWSGGALKIHDADQIADDAAAAIAEIRMSPGGELKVRTHDKLAALAQIARHLGLWTQAPDTGPAGEGVVALPDNGR